MQFFLFLSGKVGVDDAFIESLYGQINSLYRLDQIGNQAGGAGSGKAQLGELPSTAVALLVSLVGAWMLIGAYWLRQTVKQRRARQKQENNG